jgi:hypothetical protein
MRFRRASSAIAGAVVLVVLGAVTGCSPAAPSHHLSYSPASIAASTPATSDAPSTALPDSSTSQPATTSSASTTPTPSQATASSVVPLPDDTSSFSIQLEPQRIGPSAIQCPGPIEVGQIVAQSNEEVTPPEPKKTNWCDTTVRVVASAYPTVPSTGTTYIYGHSCLQHTCPFSDIACTANCTTPNPTFSVESGDHLVIKTPNGTLTEEVCGIGFSPKGEHGTLIIPPCKGGIPDTVVTTCDNENGLDNENVVTSARVVSSDGN